MSRQSRWSTTCHAWATDDGSATVELVFLAPLLLLVTMFVLGLGRFEQANLTATSTAGAAARAASLARTPAAAEAAAEAMAVASGGPSCPRPDVRLDTSAFHSGGNVKVTVVCRPSLAEITAVGLPGTVHITSTMVSGIDQWRETDSQ